jgi:hypothetical protein
MMSLRPNNVLQRNNKENVMEMTIFTAFIVLQIAARTLPETCKRIAHFAWVQRLADKHYLVWIAHPVVIKGLHDYVVHFVVYSGYVIGGH